MTAKYDWATWVLGPVQKVDSDGVESRFSIGITQTAPFRPLIPRRISQVAQCTTQVGQKPERARQTDKTQLQFPYTSQPGVIVIQAQAVKEKSGGRNVIVKPKRRGSG